MSLFNDVTIRYNKDKQIAMSVRSIINIISLLKNAMIECDI